MESLHKRLGLMLRAFDTMPTTTTASHCPCSAFSHAPFITCHDHRRSHLLALPEDLLACPSMSSSSPTPAGVIEFCDQASQLSLSATSHGVRFLLLTRGWPKFDDTWVGRTNLPPVTRDVLSKLPFQVVGIRVNAPNKEALQDFVSVVPGLGSSHRIICYAHRPNVVEAADSFIGEARDFGGSNSGGGAGGLDQQQRQKPYQEHQDNLLTSNIPTSSIRSLMGTFGRLPVGEERGGVGGQPFSLRYLASVGLGGLVRLEVRFGNIEGKALADVAASLPRLEDLAFSGTGVEDDLASLAPLAASLKKLDLYCCHKIGGSIASLVFFTKLVKLRISNCGGSGNESNHVVGDISSFSKLDMKLEEISLNLCDRVTGHLSSLHSLSAYLKKLALYKCRGISGDLSSLSSLTRLTHLELGSDNLSHGGLVGELSSLTALTCLIELEIMSCSGITGNIDSFASFQNLSILTLRSCAGIRGDISSLSALQTLNSLTLWRCDRIEGNLSSLSLGSLLGKSLAGNKLTKFVLYECLQIAITASGRWCPHINDDNGTVHCFSKKSCEELSDWLEASLGLDYLAYGRLMKY